MLLDIIVAPKPFTSPDNMPPYLEIFNASNPAISSWTRSTIELSKGTFHYRDQKLHETTHITLPKRRGFIPAQNATTAYRERKREEAVANVRVSLALFAFYMVKAAATLVRHAWPTLGSRYLVTAALCSAALGLANYAADLFVMQLLRWELTTRASRCLNRREVGNNLQKRRQGILLLVLTALLAFTCPGSAALATPPMWALTYFKWVEPNAGAELWDGGLREVLRTTTLKGVCWLALLHFPVFCLRQMTPRGIDMLNYITSWLGYES